MKKVFRIAIVGAGNAGCVTALHYQRYLSKELNNFEIEIYHSPQQHPIEKSWSGYYIKTYGTYIFRIKCKLV